MLQVVVVVHVFFNESKQIRLDIPEESGALNVIIRCPIPKCTQRYRPYSILWIESTTILSVYCYFFLVRNVSSHCQAWNIVWWEIMWNGRYKPSRVARNYSYVAGYVSSFSFSSLSVMHMLTLLYNYS